MGEGWRGCGGLLSSITSIWINLLHDIRRLKDPRRARDAMALSLASPLSPVEKQYESLLPLNYTIVSIWIVMGRGNQCIDLMALKVGHQLFT